METVVEQTLGDIECRDTCGLVFQAVEHELMFADTFDGKQVVVLEVLLYVVGVEGGHRAYVLDVLLAESKDICVSLHHDTEIAEECRDGAETVFAEIHIELAVRVFLDMGIGKQLGETFAHTHGT